MSESNKAAVPGDGRKWLSLLVGAVCVVWIACTAALYADATMPFKIGFILPLSGPLAHIGEDIRRGVHMGIEDHSAGPLQFEPIWEDSRFELKLAVNAAHKLIEQDKVDLLVTLWDTADVVAPIAEARKIAHIAIRWNHHIAEKYSYTMTLESTYRSFVESQLALLAKLHKRSMALLSEESSSAILARDYMRESAGNRGVRIVLDETLPLDTRDFRTVLLKAAKLKPDIAVLYINPPNLEIMAKQAKQLTPGLPLMAFVDTTSEVALFEGQPFVSSFEAAGWFNERFEKRYGEPFKSRAPHGYDLIMLLALAYKQHTAKLPALDLIAALTRTEAIAGASGEWNAHGSRVIESACSWKVVKHGQIGRWEP